MLSNLSNLFAPDKLIADAAQAGSVAIVQDWSFLLLNVFFMGLRIYWEHLVCKRKEAAEKSKEKEMQDLK